MNLLELFEGIEDKLFHATGVDNLYEILEANEIRANTGHPVTHTGGERRTKHWAVRPDDVGRNGYLNGVSLTRSITFALQWKSRNWSKDDSVVIVLDGALIRRDFHMMAISFWGNNHRVEAEEFVNGPIKPLSRYLIRVEALAKVAEKHDLATNLKLFNFPVQLKVR